MLHFIVIQHWEQDTDLHERLEPRKQSLDFINIFVYKQSQTGDFYFDVLFSALVIVVGGLIVLVNQRLLFMAILKLPFICLS